MKVGVIGKHAPALPALPPSQPRQQTHHAASHHHTQTSTAEVMRRKRTRSLAPAAILVITDTSGTLSPHGVIVRFNSSYSLQRFLVDEMAPYGFWEER